MCLATLVVSLHTHEVNKQKKSIVTGWILPSCELVFSALM